MPSHSLDCARNLSQLLLQLHTGRRPTAADLVGACLGQTELLHLPVLFGMRRTKNWIQLLSLGEQQRLGFARLFCRTLLQAIRFSGFAKEDVPDDRNEDAAGEGHVVLEFPEGDRGAYSGVLVRDADESKQDRQLQNQQHSINSAGVTMNLHNNNNARSRNEYHTSIKISTQKNKKPFRLLPGILAAMDESTSALDELSERRCLEGCRRLGIAMVSVTHRPQLLLYHEYLLQLKSTSSDDNSSHRENAKGPSIPSSQAQARFIKNSFYNPPEYLA